VFTEPKNPPVFFGIEFVLFSSSLTVVSDCPYSFIIAKPVAVNVFSVD
jgi:hypothetical protein